VTPRAVLWLAVVAAEGAALLLAARLDRSARAEHRSRSLRPIVALLAAALVIDLAVGLHDPPSSWGLSALAVAGPRPRVGLARAAYHLADALVMAWPGLLAATCGRVFGRQIAKLQIRAISQFAANPRRAGAPRKSANPGRDQLDSAAFRWSRTALNVLAGCYLGAIVGLAALCPLGRARTQALLLAWEAVALAFAGGAIFAGWRRVVAGGAPWSRAHGVLLVLVPVELAVAVIGPFARENVFAAWDVARWQYLLGFVVVAGLMGWPVNRSTRGTMSAGNAR